VDTHTPVSVVIPTFNRGPRLRATLDSILASDTKGLDAVEVIVVDDGSTPPAETALGNVAVPSPFSLRIVRQENAGVGGARNRGFREATGDVVLFVDDDVLLDGSALVGHVDAHRQRPGSVIFGDYPYVPGPETPFSRWTSRIGFGFGAPTNEALVESDIVASGHISVERSMFTADDGVYDDELRTPVSEEWELKVRLADRGVPVLRAPRLRGLHDRAVNLAAVCHNQYGHGFGSGEAALLRPHSLAVPALHHIVATHAPRAVGARPSVRAAAWSVLSRPPVRRALVAMAERVERRRALEPLLPPLYRLAVGAHFSAGVRDGLGLRRAPRSSSYSAS
jgi:GT2 family glycosyltransferase